MTQTKEYVRFRSLASRLQAVMRAIYQAAPAGAPVSFSQITRRVEAETGTSSSPSHQLRTLEAYDLIENLGDDGWRLSGEGLLCMQNREGPE